MKSMRGRLLFGMLLGLAALFAISATILYQYMYAVLTRQFNAALADKAHALCSLIKLQSNGELELELAQQPNLPPGGNTEFEYFQIWDEAGTVLVRSPALGKQDLPLLAAKNPVFKDINLPNGRPGRAIVLRFAPVAEDDESGDVKNIQIQPAPASGTNITVAVASERGDLDRVMAILVSALLLVAAFIGLGTALVVTFVLRHGLKPLEQVAQEAAKIDAQSLHVRFSSDGMPSELQPICRRLNDSLERLMMAFQRQRRFTADVAHELRTPIAELRSLADVALQWRSDPEMSLANFFKDAKDIAVQMEGIVTTLLALARCQSGATTVTSEAVDVGDMIKEAWLACQQKAKGRGLEFRFGITSQPILTTDRTMFISIISNLLTNAVEYASQGGVISCNVQENGSGMRLRLSNDTDFLAPDDLPHLFEAFWRKDPARTDNSHCGLGLTLVEAYAKILGGNVRVSMPAGESFCVELDLPFLI
jgi:two-component system, OmpR family, heavy metal sensor histidine kinase CusS